MLSGIVFLMIGMWFMDSCFVFRNFIDWYIIIVFYWGESFEGMWEFSVEDFDK